MFFSEQAPAKWNTQRHTASLQEAGHSRSRFIFWKKAFPNSYVLIMIAQAGATLITLGMKPEENTNVFTSEQSKHYVFI